METSFIPIDYSYFDFQGRNYIKIIGRDNNNKRICLIDDCPVFMWAVLEGKISENQINKIIEKIKKIKIESKGRKTIIEKIEIKDKLFLGKKVRALKIFATNYKDLSEIANHLVIDGIRKRRGYDLGFITHYIMEKKILPLQWYSIKGEVLDNSSEFGGIDMHLDVDSCIRLNSFKKIEDKDFEPKVLAYDIETDEFKIGEGEIVMVSLVGKNFKKVISCKKPEHLTGKNKPSYLEYVEDEAELIEKFAEYIKDYSPDVLVGYFSDGFDLPYIRARAQCNNIKLGIGLDGSQPTFSRGKVLVGKIDGIVHIDLLKFIRTAYAQYLQSETLSLNEVAKELLGDEKKEFKFIHSSKIKKEDWEKYFEYNLHDSVLTYRLFEKMWPDMKEFTRVTQEPFFDISRAGLSKIVESYLLHNLEKFNEIPERRPSPKEISRRRSRQPSMGAFVFEPKPGLYDELAFFDFTSMHTSIIVSFNLSKGTLLEKKEKDSYESPEIDYHGKKTKFYFSKEPGFFPTLVKEIFDKRKHFKSEYKKDPNPFTKARSNAFKVLSASVHGYVAFFGARYFSEEASNSILAFVRQLNQETIEKTKKEGFEVIYADTDSVAFALGKKSHSDVKTFLKKLNSSLPGIMEMELEGFYKRGIWVTKRTGGIGAKKKYALIEDSGKLKIRGFETVRRDWCRLARDVQNDVIKMILTDGNEKKALEYVKDICNKLKKRMISKEDILIKTQLKKPLSEYKAVSPHVVAARKMLKQDMQLSQGTLIKFYVSEIPGKKKSLVRDKVKLPEEEGEYDIDYYLNKQILPAIENIFNVFDVNIEEVVERKKQMTLKF